MFDMDKIDWNVIHEYRERGLLFLNKHPKYDLFILNYSPKVQFSGAWDSITRICRGLIVDKEGFIKARPFEKFFNIEENKHIATKEFEIYEKMDGSLGILFYYDIKDEWIIATRGSFSSDQAIEATKLLKKYNLEYLNKEFTYLFEIIY